MFNFLDITSYRKILLMQGLRDKNLDFNSFSTTYYMPNSDNQARNDDRLKFIVISNIQSRATEPPYGRVKRAIRPQWSRAFCATMLRSDGAF